MSQEEANSRTYRETVAAYTRGDLQPMMDLIAEDVEWISHGPSDELPAAGRFRGRSGVEHFLERLQSTVEITGYRIERTVAEGEWVIGMATVRARSKDTGRDQPFEKIDVLRYRDGKLVRFEEYFDTASLARLMK